MRLISRLRRFVPDARPRADKADWHCSQCSGDYYGERYCVNCHTGKFSIVTTPVACIEEVI
ncbi:conserved hypothetical protein [Enterobacter sp. 638]|uniref:DUF3279 domain-containing protein n=1 Tax=Enterobacter sp. (strain 638) TaxID=399742 RepID=A0A9J9KYN4_ENT38|nr:conserved hypothetical protein [Enterobacter sp. 638]